jgi:RNA polymerase sigma factor (TIGR02999 family)
LKEPAEITPLLERAHLGDHDALNEVARRVHTDLLRVAHNLTARDARAGRGPLTLDTSALVNETFIKLLQQREKWKNREHFFAIATRAMVRVLLDYHRARGRGKRGGRAIRVSLSALGPKEAIQPTLAIPDLEAVFATLEAADSRAARVAKLRILWGLEHDEIADVLAISRSTVDRDWRFAAAWIKARL